MLHPGKYSISPDPYEFLQAFQEALCIITNSFHGTVFALIMRKPFITILQKGETAVQNTRIFSLLESLGWKTGSTIRKRLHGRTTGPSH